MKFASHLKKNLLLLCVVSALLFLSYLFGSGSSST